ncbi:MAG: phage baseplate assembly protein V [Planctomycetota bacterium]
MEAITTEPQASEATAELFFGKYRGIVSDVDDPRRQGRIRARLPEVLGDVECGWALPCAPYAGDGVGFFAVPHVGAGVWIEFEAGEVSRPIWSGAWWAEGQTPSDGDPAKKTLQTESGHALVFDDGGDLEIVAGDGAKITVGSSGVKIEKGGMSVEVAGSSVSINGGAMELT